MKTTDSHHRRAGVHRRAHRQAPFPSYGGRSGRIRRAIRTPAQCARRRTGRGNVPCAVRWTNRVCQTRCHSHSQPYSSSLRAAPPLTTILLLRLDLPSLRSRPTHLLAHTHSGALFPHSPSAVLSGCVHMTTASVVAVTARLRHIPYHSECLAHAADQRKKG